MHPTQQVQEGLIRSLYENQESKIILIDEIGMLNRNDLDALRGLLNDNGFKDFKKNAILISLWKT